MFSRAVQPPGAAQVRGDQPAQARIALGIAITQLLQIRLAPESRIQLGPDVEREQIESRYTDPKRSRRAAGRLGQMMFFFDAVQRVAVDNFTGWTYRQIEPICG
nr:hypothetical protein GCM10020185_34510 [Pseudomonas brassicacearum subsp. brassicacearum]